MSTRTGTRARIGSYGRFLIRLRAFLNETLSEDAARAEIERRLAQREAAFLRLLRRSVFDNPRSPYLPLLRAAGCSFADLEAELRQHDLEVVLRRLAGAGVRMSLDEVKGRQPIERNGVSLRPAASDFDSPLIEAGLEYQTGGSTGTSTRMAFDLDFMAVRACYEHVMFRALGLYGIPLALWYPELPASTGIGNCLRYAKIGQPPKHWFGMPVSRTSGSRGFELATRMVVMESRLTAMPLPWPRRLEHDQSHRVLDWIEERIAGGGRCAVQSYVSTALRISHDARERSIDLSPVQFIVGSEPLTAAKRRAIEASGASVYERYAATEVGSIGFGCADSGDGSDFHLVQDTAVVIHEEPGEATRQPLLITSLQQTGPKVLINVDLGDVASLSQRRCSCAFGELGFETHIHDVDSRERATGEGMALPYSDLERIAEEILPARFGGSALDYQWLEEEDEQALTRLRLRVSPAVGEVNGDEVREAVLGELVELDPKNAFHVGVWRRAGTLLVVREEPERTSMGKHHSLMKAEAPSAKP